MASSLLVYPLSSTPVTEIRELQKSSFISSPNFLFTTSVHRPRPNGVRKATSKNGDWFEKDIPDTDLCDVIGFCAEGFLWVVRGEGTNYLLVFDRRVLAISAKESTFWFIAFLVFFVIAIVLMAGDGFFFLSSLKKNSLPSYIAAIVLAGFLSVVVSRMYRTYRVLPIRTWEAETNRLFSLTGYGLTMVVTGLLYRRNHPSGYFILGTLIASMCASFIAIMFFRPVSTDTDCFIPCLFPVGLTLRENKFDAWTIAVSVLSIVLAFTRATVEFNSLRNARKAAATAATVIPEARDGGERE